MICRDTALPVALVWLPGEVSTGWTPVLMAGATLMRSILATEGTPALSMAKIIQVPGGTSEARDGICTDKVLPVAAKGSSTKRCSIFQPWVAEPVLTKVTRLIGRALVTVKVTVRPTSATVGAVSMLGRAAKAAPLNR